jgi:hypothetical protein
MGQNRPRKPSTGALSRGVPIMRRTLPAREYNVIDKAKKK